MIIKKLIAGTAGAGLVLSMAGMALANQYGGYGGHRNGNNGETELTIENDADVSAYVHQKAMSGGNEIESNGRGSMRIMTGTSSNYLRLKQDVNYTALGRLGSEDMDTEIDIENDADVEANVHQYATSGENELEAEEENSHHGYGMWGMFMHGPRTFGGGGSQNDGEAVIETGTSRNEAFIDQFVNTVITTD